MKSQIHENKENKLFCLSKKLLMLLAVVLGTTVMVSAQTTPTQTAPAKEVKATKKEAKKEPKKEAKKATKAEASKPAATPAESAAAKK